MAYPWDMDILLFTAPACPGSAAARRFLRERSLPFTERDITADPAARAEFRRLGGIGTPLLVVDDVVRHGFDPNLALFAEVVKPHGPTRVPRPHQHHGGSA